MSKIIEQVRVGFRDRVVVVLLSEQNITVFRKKFPNDIDIDKLGNEQLIQFLVDNQIPYTSN